MLKIISKLWRSNEEHRQLQRKRGYRIISSYFKTRRQASGGFVLLTNEE